MKKSFLLWVTRYVNILFQDRNNKLEIIVKYNNYKIDITDTRKPELFIRL